MHKSTSTGRKKIGLYAVATTVLTGLGIAAGLMVGVTPATAANLASQPDTQIAVFMVPLTILVLAIMFEVARFATRGALPADLPVPRRPSQHWSPGQSES